MKICLFHFIILCCADALKMFATNGNPIKSNMKLMKAAFVIPLGPSRLDLLHHVLSNIEAVGVKFKRHHVVIATPVNSDKIANITANSENVLSFYKIRKTQLHWVTYELPLVTDAEKSVKCTKHGGRICHISAGRNAAMQYLEEHLRDVDVVIPTDSDMCRQWNPNVFEQALQFEGEWSGLTANGIGSPETKEGYFYLDWLAFKHLNNNYNSSLQQSIVPYKRNVLHPQLAPFEVQSGFGGLGIYRMQDITGCRYGTKQCEHWGFHDCLQEKGKKVFVHPALVIEWRDIFHKDDTKQECAQTWQSAPPQYDFQHAYELHETTGKFPEHFKMHFPLQEQI